MSAVAITEPSNRIGDTREAPTVCRVHSIYIDCTHVYQTKNSSGIARVVRNLAILGSEMSPELGVQVRPMLLTGRGFAVINPAWLTPRKPGTVVRFARWCSAGFLSMLRSLDSFVIHAPIVVGAFLAGIGGRIRGFANLVLRTAMLVLPAPLMGRLRKLARWFGVRLIDPEAGRVGTRWVFTLLRVVLGLCVWCGQWIARFFSFNLDAVQKGARNARKLIRHGFLWIRSRRADIGQGLLALRLRKRHLELGAGDVLLLADSNWDSRCLWPLVERARKRGAIVASVVYDLIPLRMPDFVDGNLSRVFTNHLKQVASHNDFIVAISRDTCLDFLDFARSTSNSGWSSARARTFRLGGDKWTEVQTSCSEACEEVVRRIGSRAAYLIVGTFEIRKNHRAVLDAFDQIWKEGGDVCLLILGKPGYRVEDQIARVRSHREWGSRLFWATNASDGDLESWYRISRGVIMASYAEGFGLPVAEALSRGKSAIISDIPAHREIAGGFCEFFDPSRPDELADLLRRDLAGDRNPDLRPVTDFDWPDWQASVRECLRECIATASLGPRESPSPAIHLPSF